MPLPFLSSGSSQKDRQEQAEVRMGRIWDPELAACCSECKMMRPLCKNGLVASQNVKHGITIWPSNSAPRYLPRRHGSLRPHKSWCTHVIAAPFIRVKKCGGTPKCVSTHEQINKMQILLRYNKEGTDVHSNTDTW
ncbi:hypothetical protein HJG60_009115 [Phyllostomus discolor]|uniref:Uncharacterized protein n=1 Tax=Phyllostomus discolor TaxID=89673 RepID=A0A833YPV8_9CHIR|nr:hypothetical protein HJG60_009115 [Phyllostomus discolor]